jgi:sterol desaturase/sphingolipid hydroxylase (fatty acid hydroxylase superfamily)
LFLSALALAVGLAALVGERRRPLRRPTQRWLARDVRNGAITGLATLTVSLLERPLTDPLSRWVQRRRIGLVQRLPVPLWARDALAVVLLDYGLYVWHVLTHKTPALWRFHQVHHADLDVSASTALRFHFGEMAASVPWRVGQILLTGAGPRALNSWRTLLLGSIVFHHSNWRLPTGLERRLNWLIVSPRLHGVHHDAHRSGSDSNWSSGLTWWDRLHGTFQDRPQPALLGVAELRRPEQVWLGRLLVLPFSRAE